MSSQKFYDIHFHAMDLSHANITAFADRFINNTDAIKEMLDNDLPWWKKTLVSLAMPVVGPFVSNKFLARKITEQIGKLQHVRNLLSFMETSVMFDFLIIEYFLKTEHKGVKSLVGQDNTFSIGGNQYNKLVICPLVMDFGYPDIKNNDIYYNIPPQKPVVNQISDLFQAINFYYTKELKIKNENNIIRFEAFGTEKKKNERLFEIYPFMGINTANYTIAKIEAMLQKYFGDFKKEDTPEERYRKLNEAMGEFDGELSNECKCRNIFAGIKLYPPLGFDPWPDSAEERIKVEKLYQYCVDRNIPIITHCSTGGFVASPEHKKLTDPGGQWAKVLSDSRFSGLRIDFAHMGEDDPVWTNTIIKLAADKEKNVYTDISSICDYPEYYLKLKKIISENDPIVNSKILFGTDFMINLLKLNSYSGYIELYDKTEYLTTEQKSGFANSNPEKFLFG